MAWLTGYCRRVLALTDAPVEFGVIPGEHWNQPDWIDEERALESRKKMKHDGVMYGGASSAVHTLTAAHHIAGSLSYARSRFPNPSLIS